ncbi:MAG: hypothetical protein EA366_03325 [Spirulina sp. DLM2.Bin59]|nr:MAG: hypothetical protein EA366_03325 [Spirulina sp. DLM2.Bin59]
MAECPVCQAQYVSGKVDRCHVCGWQLSNTSTSRLGPFRLEHQVSATALMGLEAWARHMWTTVQQQKNRIAQLQSAQSLSPATMLSGQTPEPLKPTHSHSTEQPEDLIDWIVGCFAQADQERSQLLFQISQLRAELQRLANLVDHPTPAQISPPPQAIAPDLGPSNLEQQAQITAIQEAQGALAAELRQLQQQPPLALDLPSLEDMTAQLQPYIEGRLATLTTQQQHSAAHVQNQLVDFQERIQALQTQQGEQQAQFQQHITEQHQQFHDQLNDHMAAIHDNHGQRLERLEGAIAHQTQTLYSQNGQIQHQQNQWEKVLAAQTELAKTVASLQAQVTAQAATNQSHHNALEVLQLQGEQVLTRQDQQQQQITTLQSGMEMFQARTGAEQAAMAGQLQKLSNLAGQMDQLESGLAGVQKALQNLPRIVTPSHRSTAAVYTRYQQSSN